MLIVGGVLVGPQVLGWADPTSLTLLANVGLGFLFLLAGYELELDLFRERAAGWPSSAGSSRAAIAVLVTGVLAAVGFIHAFVPVALGLTTTAFGTLLPILRDNDMLAGSLGRFILPAGAVGEFLPIVGIAIFLSANGRFLGLVSLVAMFVVAVGFAYLPRLTHVRAVLRHHPRRRARDLPDHPAADRRPAVRAADGGEPVRPGRGPRRVPRRRGAAAVGARGRALAGDQARRGRLRLLHPGLLRLLGHEPRPRLDRRGARCGCWCSSCCCWRSAACRPCCSTATTSAAASACRWPSSPRPRSRCSSRCPRSASAPGTCSPRTPPRSSAPACCRWWSSPGPRWR